MDEKKPDWDPRAAHVLEDQIIAYDEMRKKCPVAHSDFLKWSLFRHEDIMMVLNDHETFSSNVSAHVSVPNSMDPPEHTEFRKVIEPYFSAEAMADFEPVCRALARKLVASIPRNQPVEFMREFATKFALQVQCAFLGLPEELQETLQLWMRKNHEATLLRDRTAMTDIAAEFAGIVHILIEARNAAGDHASDDVITSLMRSEVERRPLKEEEIVSILRNWTGGEVGTISASVGILTHYLAENPVLQNEVRSHPEMLPEAIEEILRIHGPLVTNRRKTTCPVMIGDRHIGAGEVLSLFWVSANRDEQVFEDPGLFRWGRDHSRNLLYGAGVHWCPGAPLARMELRVIMEELLAQTANLALAPELPTPKAVYPAGGYAETHIIVS